MSEQERKPRVYISSPGYNEPQQIGSNKLQAVIEEAGYEPVMPMISAVIPPAEEAQKCLTALRDSDLLVVWLDGLTAPGVSIYTVGNVQTQAEINFPPEAVELMQAGALTMKKMGKGSKQRKGIILPHELNAPPPVPAGCTVDYGQIGKALCGLIGKPMNFPDVSIIFETAYAFAAGIPLVVLTILEPEIGMYLGWTGDVYVKSFEAAKHVLVDYFPHALKGSIGEKRKELAAIQKVRGYDPLEVYKKRLEAKKAAAEKAKEEETTPEEPPVDAASK